MARETLEQCSDILARCAIRTVDITGLVADRLAQATPPAPPAAPSPGTVPPAPSSPGSIPPPPPSSPGMR